MKKLTLVSAAILGVASLVLSANVMALSGDNEGKAAYKKSNDEKLEHKGAMHKKHSSKNHHKNHHEAMMKKHHDDKRGLEAQ